MFILWFTNSFYSHICLLVSYRFIYKRSTLYNLNSLGYLISKSIRYLASISQTMFQRTLTLSEMLTDVLVDYTTNQLNKNFFFFNLVINYPFIIHFQDRYKISNTFIELLWSWKLWFKEVFFICKCRHKVER